MRITLSPLRDAIASSLLILVFTAGSGKTMAQETAPDGKSALGGPAEEEAEDPELAALRAMAEEASGETSGTQKAAEQPPSVFKALGQSLQGLNPEFSIVGDMLGSYHAREGLREQWDFLFRHLALHFQAYIDPYTKFFAAFPVTETGVPGIGEAFVTRQALLPGVSLTAGKFRQHFGAVNRWHKPALDQTDFPLALRNIFGPGGLAQTGLSLHWHMPALWAASEDLYLEVTDGENGRMFSGNTLTNPSALLHLKSYWDLSKETYFEMGITGLLGSSDRWTIDYGAGAVTEYRTCPAGVLGIDVSMLHEPAGSMRYFNVEFKGEAWLALKGVMAPDGTGYDVVSAWGAYAYLQSKISRTIEIGLRADYWQPDGKDYAANPLFAFPHLASTSKTAWRGQASAYVTWSQSPWLKLRAEYQYLDGHAMGTPEHWFVLQLIFSVGPHLHERY